MERENPVLSRESGDGRREGGGEQNSILWDADFRRFARTEKESSNESV
jgi:hypothetical protein